MLDGKRFLAIIPARSGSKRLPRKNVLPLGGKPLIVHTIEAAARCSELDRVVVSTDGAEIAAVASAAGADVPYLRPPELATDSAGSVEVVVHMLDHFERQGESFDYVVLLQPTSPLRSTGDIRKALQLAVDRRASSVIGVSKVSHGPHIMLQLSPSLTVCPGSVERLYEGASAGGEYWVVNGAVYVVDVAHLRRTGRFLSVDATVAHPMPAERSIDIDTLVDFRVAEALMDVSAP